MINSSGNNHFKDNTFSFWTWSAPVLQTPEEVVAKVHELKIINRVVKDIRAIGHNYGFMSSDKCYDIFKAMHCNDAKALSTLDFECCIEIDEPMLIQFEDGDILGIDFSEGSSIRLEMNTLPWDILPGTSERNFHANQMFSDILGKRIADALFTTSLNHPMFTGSFGMYLDNQASYLKKVTFLCRDKNAGTKATPARRLTFEASLDYGLVSLGDDTSILTLPATRLKDVMEGYLTPHDLEKYLEIDS